MAMDNPIPVLVVPSLFALLYLTALILALVYYRRCPAACSLVVSASILNLAITVMRVAYQTMGLRDGDFRTFSIVMTGLAVGNWVAYGLMIIAVFVGRHQMAA